MKDIPFTWKDYLLEQLHEEHVVKKITELKDAFMKHDEEPEYTLSYLVFSGTDNSAIILSAEDCAYDPDYLQNNLVQFTAVKNEVDSTYTSILNETITDFNRV